MYWSRVGCIGADSDGLEQTRMDWSRLGHRAPVHPAIGPPRPRVRAQPWPASHAQAQPRTMAIAAAPPALGPREGGTSARAAGHCFRHGMAAPGALLLTAWRCGIPWRIPSHSESFRVIPSHSESFRVIPSHSESFRGQGTSRRTTASPSPRPPSSAVRTPLPPFADGDADGGSNPPPPALAQGFESAVRTPPHPLAQWFRKRWAAQGLAWSRAAGHV
jgi:hypothetical protein